MWCVVLACVCRCRRLGVPRLCQCGGACGNLSSGGGGGSGYTNGSVNLLFGQVGGNGNSQASALIELITDPGQKFLFLVRGV